MGHCKPWIAVWTVAPRAKDVRAAVGKLFVAENVHDGWEEARQRGWRLKKVRISVI